MELSEEKELKKITGEFGKGVKAFKEQECNQAVEIFDRIAEKYSDSEYYSVLEIRARSKVYGAICKSRANPVKTPLEENEDYLFDGIYYLNAGDTDKALERFEYLQKANYGDPYLNYLLALVYLKKEKTDTCLEYLKKAVVKDATYKIVAHNEPDFDPLFENDVFVSLIEDQF